MNKIFSFILASCLMITAISCDDFLSEDPTTAIPDENAFLTAADYENAINGVYYTLGTYRFLGRDILGLGDLAGDLSAHSAATTHFLNLFNYQIQETNSYLEEMWAYGYYSIDRSARIIEAGLVADLLDSEMGTVNSCVAQAYGVKALSTFILTNIFGLPYSETNKSTLGVVNMGDAPLPDYEKVSRATVEDNYRQVLADIAKSKEYYGKPGVSSVGYEGMNLAAVYALEARVKLYMEDYAGAIAAANAAIEARGGAIVSTVNAYQNMFRELTISTEDIFVLVKSDTDYLSANSLSTLWTTYGLSLNADFISEFADDDIRAAWLDANDWNGGKMGGIWTNDQIQNLPVFRLPELYLTLAEAYAATGDYAKAKANLLEVAAKRNPSLNVDGIQENASIMDIIKQERKLELAQEGHRFFDARRYGQTIDVSNGTLKNFDIAKFQYPIPAGEVNSGYGVTQTPNWSANLPK